ncbi:MAG TPA: TetR family transcriptional regulator [Thermoanaerobaculia bacterium]|jgi:AcrR family transcriptional regulator
MHHPKAGKSKEEVVQEYRIQSIQDATMRVIARKGMAAATMQEIADEAGVAKGTIYLYFRDRDELVEKTFDSSIQLLMERIDAAIEQDLPIDAKIRAIMSAHLSFFGENREFFRLYLSMRMPEGPAARQRRQKQNCQPQYRARAQKFADALKEAMDRGEVRVADPLKLALFILEGSTAVILARLTDEAPASEVEDVDLLTGLILDGIRKRS